MADAMPKCGGDNQEHFVELSSDEDSLLNSPVRGKGETSGGNSDNLFRSEFHKKRWESFERRGFLDDRFVQNKALMFGGIDQLLSELRLDKSVLEMCPYVPEVVREFYINLDASMRERNYEHIHKVFVRGKFFNFSLVIIDHELGRESVTDNGQCVDFSSYVVDFDEVVEEITGTIYYFWPEERKEFQSFSLSSKYFMLFTLAIQNWLPSTHRTTVGHDIAKLLYLIGTKKNVNFGDLIYSRVCNYIGKTGTAKRLAYPGLIFKILKSQGVTGYKADSLPCCLGALRPSVKIFDTRHHVDDVRGANVYASGNVDKNAADASVPDEDESVIPDEMTGEDATLITSVPIVVLCTVRKKLEKELGKITKHLEFLSGYKSTVESVLQLLPKAGATKSTDTVQDDGASGSGGADQAANQENAEVVREVAAEVAGDADVDARHADGIHEDAAIADKEANVATDSIGVDDTVDADQGLEN